MPRLSLRRFAILLGLVLVAPAMLPALADVRVWTDHEEIILKGTLQGVEVLTDGAGEATGRPTAMPAVALIPPADAAAEPLRTIQVASARALFDAIAQAKPGDHIILKPGIYVIERNSITLNRPGTAAHPIVITADEPRTAVVFMTGQNGFLISQPYWIVENLEIEGTCPKDDTCEHAFHIVGAADRTIIRGNRIVEFNAPIKSNGIKVANAWLYPDYALIEGNAIYNSRARNTANPVTGIDVVGGQGWIVRDNYLADFGKKRGNQTTYAAFLKGGSSDGVFERNLVACRQANSGGIRVGLSFGGGGTNLSEFCDGPNCNSEHRNGTMRNNIVMACNDVGIYLNKAAGSQIINNMLYDTKGIDVRFPETTADIRNNILSGAIRIRNDAKATRRNNVIVASPVQFNTWFADPRRADFTLINPNFFVDKGEAIPELTDDFCGNDRRAGAPDIGPIEFIQNKACNVAGRMDVNN